jgi:hypothetical protein
LVLHSYGHSTRPAQSTIAAENFIAKMVSTTDRAAIVMTMCFDLLIAFSFVEHGRRPSASINADASDFASFVMMTFFDSLIVFSSVVAEQSRRPSALINAGVGTYASSVFWVRSFAVTRLSPL